MECFKLIGFDENFKSTNFDNYIKQTAKNPLSIKEAVKKSNDELYVDGDVLQKIWFPVDKNYGAFISHSHENINIALHIVAEIEKRFECNCFIDSQVWNHYKFMENELHFMFPTKNEEGIRVSTYMLLTEALFRVISISQCFLFLETNNSIDYKNNRVTYSPWLFYELSIAKQL